MPSLAFIHTVPDLAATFRPLAAAILPDWTSFNIADESLLKNTIRDGALSVKTMQRLSQYIFLATEGGADAIVVTCSTLGGAVDLIRPLSSVPLFRIDRGMAVEAVRRAKRIGVLATLPTTLEPTRALLEETAATAGKGCEITSRLCEGAFERLATGDRTGHDRLVIDGYRDLAASVELVVLAQASMAQALSSVNEAPDVPVLTSPQLGMAHVAGLLAVL
ncbi:Asp/Glu/hydantoin racemase [Rhizobium sp. P32RR-XVIII]|uniref:aspartate/glutamate racemase family protein n=1 Tax=Rhizobium sp. P32RR-XVIII TaxID=2726738 RepID=UPI001457824D|nr:aspartate/glutamate racemase family protein [Rhizobium sp. P32RR-XVIII]NLS06997.1 Asp/Glu/hydantoin racemase [Rhizobium sp. P32RR-XVIII]